MMYKKLINTPLGTMYAYATSQGLCSLRFITNNKTDNKPYQVINSDKNSLVEPLIRVEYELDRYFAGRLHVFQTPIILNTTAFQRQVFKILQQLSFGTTVSYQYIAAELGNYQAARAVGRAIGLNPLALIIPCHRVIPKQRNAGLGGYNAGIKRKKALLAHEKTVIINN